MKTSVRFLAVLFALIMAMFTAAYAADYSDVEPSHANYDAIELLSDLAVLHGYEDGTFRPADPVQRDEMAKMVYIMATSFEDAGAGAKIFPDIESNHWASGFITWAHSMGIVGGYEDGSFRPDENITYDEALKMACAMLGYTDFSSELWPTDVRMVALSQLGLDENLDELKTQKVVEGETIDTIAGDTKITRAQAAQIIWNCFYKTMATTKTETYFDTNKNINVNVEVPMTLAADVWYFDTVEYLIVGTKNFAIKDTVKGFTSTKTGKDDTIVIWDGNDLVDIVLSEFGLDEYEGDTDSLLGLTITKITKEGRDLAVSGIKGARHTGVYLSTIAAESTDAPVWNSGAAYWYSDRLNVNGVVYSGDDFWNLRSVYVDPNNTTDTVFVVQDRPIGFSDILYGQQGNENYKWSTEAGDFAINFSGREVDFNSYMIIMAYPKTVWGVDSEGDGKIDYLFLKYNQPYEVLSVKNIVNNGVEDQEITLKHLYDTTLSPIVVYKSTTTFAKELNEGDVLVGAVYGNRLYVETVAKTYVTSVTSVASDKKSVTLDGRGKVSIGYDFAGHAIGSTYNTREKILDVSDVDKLLATQPDGSNYEITVWLYQNYMIASSEANSGDSASKGYNKAVLLCVDDKTEPQHDKATNKYTSFYPAYLLVNGKEEAVNLDRTAAIDNASGDWAVEAYGAKYGEDYIIDYEYKLVTYTKNADGFYSLYTENDTKYEEDGVTPIELVIPETENPKLQYNKATGLFKIVTDNATYHNIDIDENTYLYYTYMASTGSFVHMGFYTNESFTGEFDSIDFASDVFLSYNAEDDFYTISTAILAGKIESATGSTDDSVDYTKDARAILVAATDSSVVKYNGEAYYEHSLMNILTGEITTAIQTKRSVAESAEKLIAGNFYAWSDTEQDYVKVDGTTNSIIATLIERIDERRGILYTASGSEYEHGIKLADDFVFVAFDDDMNRYELTFDELLAIKSLYDEESASMGIIFITYEEDSEQQLAYALVDFAEKLNGVTTLHYAVNTNLVTVPTP